MKKFFKKYWLECIFFGLAVICDAWMDHISFRFPRDSGFFSVHTTDTIDAWHLAKYLHWLFIILAVLRVRNIYEKSKWYGFILLCSINLLFHETFLHIFFKR